MTKDVRCSQCGHCLFNYSRQNNGMLVTVVEVHYINLSTGERICKKCYEKLHK